MPMSENIFLALIFGWMFVQMACDWSK